MLVQIGAVRFKLAQLLDPLRGNDLVEPDLGAEGPNEPLEGAAALQMPKIDPHRTLALGPDGVTVQAQHDQRVGVVRHPEDVIEL